MKHIEFQDKNGTFIIQNPENYGEIYLPLAGESGMKSSITSNLAGDSKTDQNHFLLEPVSAENLHNNKNTRNFWCRIEKKGYWSVWGNSAEQEYQKFTEEQDESVLEAGFMWQKLTRSSKKYELKAETTSFVTVDGKMEVSLVKLTNSSKDKMEITPIAAIPIYGRSADNIRDHRHVTSLLHRIHTTDSGVEVTPVLSFDERGHQKNDTTYFVSGFTGNGAYPTEFYPTVEAFIGEGGSFLIPEAVRKEKTGEKRGCDIKGKEAVGGIRFSKIVLDPQEVASYIILSGIVKKTEQVETMISAYQTENQVKSALEEVKKHWTERVNVSFETGNREEDNYLKWICFQPILRRIYGCSFLPYHDYGKGGRGWRDLWQDCLALLIMEPSAVRQMIVDNYGGVRIDGTNATIIGNVQGEFIADRNNITRVWMDHAFWPFVTTKLYMDQTGDMDILFQKIPYFKDLQTERGTTHDEIWNSKDGNYQRTEAGAIYHGTVLEHILLQNLCAFYDVGEHNQIRLHGADWNDALDMAWERGESVAFTCAYAGNLKEIAKYLRRLRIVSGISKTEIAEEMMCLLSGSNEQYKNPTEKIQILKSFAEKCKHKISGNVAIVKLERIIKNLEEKADWLMENVRSHEWVQDKDHQGWFNGYYDNHGKKVEHCKDENVRMMLTGQVFAVMSGTANDEQIEAICRSADRYLYDKKAGGYRLNTDFKEEKFDFGRMFGFAYGEKENGAVFSHMAVMYANALYARGLAKEGHKVLQALMDAAMDFENSRMYPGLPEYFDNQGKGLYTYLTGAASWYMLTMITEVFGVKGKFGDLVIAPALMPEQFNEKGIASLKLEFAGKKFDIQFYNPEKMTCENAKIKSATCDGDEMQFEEEFGVCLKKTQIEKLSSRIIHKIEVVYHMAL
ncbi:MAG: cellobiose phosphorylase [Lachnospiraceae bacterium]|nr:cellobiose phosphorylase [Lachnospiraceae bacterium]